MTEFKIHSVEIVSEVSQVSQVDFEIPSLIVLIGFRLISTTN